MTSAIFLLILYNDHMLMIRVPSDPEPDLVQDDLPFDGLQFTVDEVQSILLFPDVSKVEGPDGIPPIILKNCASNFARPLSLLYLTDLYRHVFFLTGVNFPTYHEILKKGRRNNVEDYPEVFWNAGDREHHQLLLEEMSVGIEPARCLWLRSYLTGRIQRIRISDALSKDIMMTSGVPQGSRLRRQTIVFHLVCQQNIDDFRLRQCVVLGR
jgi:hypothetical protein